MSHYQIAVLVGSFRKESLNRKLADALVKLAPPDFTFTQVRIDDLPLYNMDEDGDQRPCVRRLKAELEASHGFLFVTPEYNRSIPGLLKNAIDHASRPYGKSSWAGKPAGMVGVSPGANRHRPGAAAPARHPGHPGHADPGPARSLPPIQGRSLRRVRRHRGRQPQIPAEMDGPICRVGEAARELKQLKNTTRRVAEIERGAAEEDELGFMWIMTKAAWPMPGRC